MTKLWVVILACVVVASAVLAYPQTPADYDAEFARQLISRAYSALSKTKRSPSIGLSLAEYMASPQGGDNFHFIPSGRK